MTGPEQPWWVRPGGAPPPGGAPGPNARPARPAWPGSSGPPPPHRPRPAPPQRPAPPPPRAQRPILPPQEPSRSARPKPGQQRVLIGAAIAVGVVVLAGAGVWMWTRADSSGTQLDVHQAEAGVAQILSDPINGYGANRVAAVACNNGKNPVVRTGATFTCAVEMNDTLRRVIVEFTDEQGTYAVDGPR